MTSRQPPPQLDAAWDEGTEVSDPPIEERAPAALPLRAPSPPEPNSKKTMLGVPAIRLPATLTPPAGSPGVRAPAASPAATPLPGVAPMPAVAAPVVTAPRAVTPPAGAPVAAAAAVPEEMHREPVSSRVPRAGTVMGSGGVSRVPARVVAEVSYEADVPIDDDPQPTMIEAPRVPSTALASTSQRTLDPVAAAAAAVIAARAAKPGAIPDAPAQLARPSEPALDSSRIEPAVPARRGARYIAFAAIALVCIGVGVAGALVTRSDDRASSSSVAMTSESTAKVAMPEPTKPVAEAPAPAADVAAVEPAAAEPVAAEPVAAAEPAAAVEDAAPPPSVQRPAKKPAKAAPKVATKAAPKVATKAAPTVATKAAAKRAPAKPSPSAKPRKKAAPACSDMSCL